MRMRCFRCGSLIEVEADSLKHYEKLKCPECGAIT